MTITTESPRLNGVDVATLFATLDAVKGTERDREVPVPGHQQLGQRAPTAGRRTPASTAPARRWQHRQRDRGRLRPPGGTGRRRTTARRRSSTCCTPSPPASPPGIANIAAARGVKLTKVVLDRRGRHRPARHPRAVRRPVRNGYEQIKVTFHIEGDADDETAARPRRAVPPALRRVRRAHQPDARRHRRRHRLTAHRPDGRPDHRPATTSRTVDTIDTVVIGAGHAGLAVSRLLTDAGREHVVLDRGRIGERWRTERWDSLHLLTPSWMTRLPGWSYRGPRPGRLPQRRPASSATSRSTPRRSAPRSSTARRCEEVAPGARRRARRYRVVTDRGTWHARHVVIATGPHGDAARAGRACDADRGRGADRERLPQPRPGSPPGGVLVVGASASGVQIADELSRAGREVDARGRPAHPDAPPLPRAGHLLVAREHRPAGPHHRRGARPGGRAPRALAAAGRPRRPGRGRDRDLDLGRCRAAASGWPAGSTSVTGRDRPLRRRPAEHRRRRGPERCTASSTPSTATSTQAGLDRRGLVAGVRPRPVPCVRRPTRLDLRAERIGTVAAGDRLPAAPPVAAAARHRRRTARSGSDRGVTPAPGVYVVGQRFQHRRDSGFIDGARHDARAVVAHLLGPAHRGRPPAAACPARSAHHERLRRRRGRRPGRRAPRPRCCSPGPGPGRRCVERGRLRQRHGLDPRADAGRRAAAVALGAARPRRRRGHAAGPAHALPLRRTASRCGCRSGPSPGVDALYAPRRTLLDRILVDAAAEAGRGRAARRTDRDRRCSATADGRVRGVRAPGRRGVASSSRPARRSAPTGSGRPSRREVGAHVVRQGRTASAVLYRYFTGLAADRLRVGLRRRARRPG